LTDMRDMTTRTRLITSVFIATLSLSGATMDYARAQDEVAPEMRREATAAELERVKAELALSQERSAAIAEEVAAIRKDHESLTEALVLAAQNERKLAQEVAEITQRLDVLHLREGDLRSSLRERRGVLAEVLGALQRMGLNPPPAILVRPEDALSSVRSSILLGAVVPELREETQVLIGDLQELARIMETIRAQQASQLEALSRQAEEQARLSLLVEERAKLRDETEAQLVLEQSRAEELAREASSLLELIDALEGEIEMAAARAARQESEREAMQDPPVALGANQPLSELMGRLDLPVSGQIQRRFGESDGSGGTMQGDMVATHSTAIVTTPVSGSVLYAGPFRSYGQLLILNAGDGYHIVLAGMGRISVSPGQPVIAGEPVGLMGEASLASAVAFTEGSTGPELYVEFRKEGKPIDPAPWWAGRSSGRTGNDT
jgi:septal ring factor EnvC (AmiA/AmiB activator)